MSYTFYKKVSYDLIEDQEQEIEFNGSLFLLSDPVNETTIQLKLPGASSVYGILDIVPANTYRGDLSKILPLKGCTIKPVGGSAKIIVYVK